MVILYKLIGYIGIIGGVFISIFSPIFSINKPDIYTIAGGIAAIIYGIIAFIKASYFEKLESVTEETKTTTKMILDILNHQTAGQNPAPVQTQEPTQDQNFSSWKRQG